MTNPRTIEVRDADVPTPGPGEVLVQALASAISAGTEMNVYRGYAPQWHQKQDPRTRLFLESHEPEWRYPIAYGYACVGTVISLGKGVQSVEEGQLVFTYSPHSSYSVAKADRVIPLPNLSSPELGVFLANLSTAYNGILDARPPLGANVVVFGLGVIGQLVVRLLRQTGAHQLIAVDTIAARREVAMASGVDAALDPGDGSIAEKVRDLTDGQGADIVIEVSGAAPALNEAIRTVGFNGLIVAMSWYGGTFEGLNLSGEFHHNRPRIYSSQVGALNPDLGPLWSVSRRTKQAVKLLPRLDLQTLITHRIPVVDAPHAYQLIDERPEEVLQVILTYEDST
jgi:2-desacetyl-2-hydroxyethyl bacteriochlorophyllide A dehydrogenase